MARQARVVVKSKTADLVREWIDSHHTKTQDDIAIETGFTRSNVLSMIKQGRTKMPFDKIEPFAKACGRDPEELLKTALREYAPELARLIGRVQGVPMFEHGEVIIDTFNTAITEVIEEARAAHKEAAQNEVEQQQATRLNAQLNLEASRLSELKKFIKRRMVQVVSGDDVVSVTPAAANVI